MAFPKGAAALLAEKDFKGSFVTSDFNDTTVGGAENILPGDPERTIVVLYNLSPSEIFIGFSANVTPNNGMLIPPNGGFLLINASEDYEVATLPLYVYASSIGYRYYVMTTRRETGLKE